MYAIGRTDYDFIQVTYVATMYDGHKLWNEVQKVEYAANLANATIIPDIEVAKQLIEDIQSNVENIKFTNSSVIGEILGEESFDKVAYSTDLKIYELVPTLVQKGECK